VIPSHDPSRTSRLRHRLAKIPLIQRKISSCERVRRFLPAIFGETPSQKILAKEGWTPTEIYQQTTSKLRQSEAVVALDKAAIAKAQLDLGRTVIRSPVNGYVTNLRAQLGDYATVGQKIISVIDADSFWIDGYFEESSLERIHEGDPAIVKLMGYSHVVHGHVGGVARGISVPNAQPDQAGLASVNPIFTWVRLAQRVPVRIHIDQVPDGVRLVAGMTATVQIDPQPKP
jgi:multidrug resistance efflux pump